MSTAKNAGSKTTTIIVGAGLAGVEIALELRRLGAEGRIVIIGEEPWLPYKRPPLSKGFLAAEIGDEQLLVRSSEALKRDEIEVECGVSVVRIDRAARQVELADGRRLAYDKLALATGGRPRRLDLAGIEQANVYMLRTIDDALALRAEFRAGRRLVIIGGGYIGLEVASLAIGKGLEVTLLESAERILSRVAAPEISAFYERLHRQAGVDLRTGVRITAFADDNGLTELVLEDGTRIGADAVLVGIGLVANVELAAAAGLATDDGIVVDEYSRTSDPDIVAAGDCANRPSAAAGRRVRLESVPNAMAQARHAARTLFGQPEVYDVSPWFWSDQYDLKLQIAGLSHGYTELVLRGAPDSRSFIAFYLRDGHIIAADSVSRLREFGVVKKLVAAQARISTEQLRDETTALEDLLSELPA